MRRTLRSFVVLLAAALAVGAFADAPWLGSFDQASKASKATGRPILMLFTGSDWCPPCKALEGEVFSSPTFATWAKQHVVLLRLDFPRRHPQPDAIKAANQALQMRYKVDAFPTVMFLSPRGQILGRQAGYDSVGPSFWTKTAEFVMRPRS